MPRNALAAGYRRSLSLLTANVGGSSYGAVVGDLPTNALIELRPHAGRHDRRLIDRELRRREKKGAAR